MEPNDRWFPGRIVDGDDVKPAGAYPGRGALPGSVQRSGLVRVVFLL